MNIPSTPEGFALLALAALVVGLGLVVGMAIGRSLVHAVARRRDPPPSKA